MNRKILIEKFVAKVIGEFSTSGTGAAWLEKIEIDTGLNYPPSFTELLKNYAFPPFVANDIEFMGNSGIDDEDNIQIAIYRDEILFRSLVKNGFLQFGKPSDGSYDPICFNTKKNAHNREHEIVRLDHEELLMYEKPVIVSVIAHSFLEFMENYLLSGCK